METIKWKGKSAERKFKLHEITWKEWKESRCKLNKTKEEEEEKYVYGTQKNHY